MKSLSIEKTFSIDENLIPSLRTRQVARKLVPEPDFHWENKATMYRNIQSALGYTSIWDVYETINFNDVAFEGYISTLHHVYFPDINIPIGKENPTWFDIWNACEKAILKSLKAGWHHQYIERVNRQGSSLYLHTGS